MDGWIISEVISLTYIIYYFFKPLFHGGSRSSAYIVVVFATQILASSIRSPKSLLRNRQYKSH